MSALLVFGEARSSERSVVREQDLSPHFFRARKAF